MPAVAPVPFAPFWGHDDDADPLAGGALYAFAAGTDTPLTTYANPQGTTLNPHPVTLDDAGYAHVYLHAGVPYKLRLVNNLGVQQWEIDQVYGSGAGGGSSAAGLGWGKNTVLLRPAPNSPQATATVFPADVLAVGVTVWISETLGASQGLEQVGVGTAERPDCWGLLPALAADTESTAGLFQGYSGQPQPVAGLVTLTAYGGLFDGAGAVMVTGHFCTCTPGHEVGYNYLPGVPETGQILPPVPAASETVAGIVELATPTEVTTGTDATRAVTPAGLTAKLPAGTPLRLARYAAGGTALEATEGLTTTSDGRLGVGGTPETQDMLRVVALGGSVPNITYSRSITGSGAIVVNLRKSRGSDGTPSVVAANDQLGSVHWMAYTRDAADTQHGDQVLTVLRAYVEAVDAQNRASAHLRLFTSEASAAATEKLRLTAAGNLLLGATSFGTGLRSGLVLGPGVEPSTSPTDTVQLTAIDRGGTAGKRSLHVRTEDGTSHVLGDQSGLGTTLAATLGSGASYQALTVKGSHLLVGQSSVQERPQALVAASWVSSVDATRTSRLALSAYDATAAREGLRIEADGAAARLAFYGSAAVGKPTVSGAKGGNVALASLLTALSSLGLVTDTSTA